MPRSSHRRLRRNFLQIIDNRYTSKKTCTVLLLPLTLVPGNSFNGNLPFMPTLVVVRITCRETPGRTIILYAKDHDFSAIDFLRLSHINSYQNDIPRYHEGDPLLTDKSNSLIITPKKSGFLFLYYPVALVNLTSFSSLQKAYRKIGAQIQ
jgi:hypothetical protein